MEPDKIFKYLGTIICSHGKTHNSDTIVGYKEARQLDYIAKKSSKNYASASNSFWH
jgi:hypothetical protein